jgi:hypothetical protein
MSTKESYPMSRAFLYGPASATSKEFAEMHAREAGKRGSE